MDKNTILSVLTPKQIILSFLNLSYIPKGNISSPFSKDKKPSFKLYENCTYKCNSTGKQGDCFQFVADLHNIDCKTNFNDVLQLIATKFPAFDFTKPIPEHQKIIIKEIPIVPSNNEQHFCYTTKAFTKEHLDYFSQSNWNVSREILEKYKVFALDKFEFFNSKKRRNYKAKII